MKFRHLGRSFYSEECYAQELRDREVATAAEAEKSSREASDVPAEEVTKAPANRQEEARLVTYVKAALEDLYASEAGPEDTDFVFDVHSTRKGTGFENVDLVAVHWRTNNFCDLITVEVKLEFSAHAIQQALNYKRFSHRAWVAVVVGSDEKDELPRRYPTLFEYTISNGLGVLACRRRPGRGGSYEVTPIHWPLRSLSDPLEEEDFLERYREQFEKAGVIEPDNKKRFPRLR